MPATSPVATPGAEPTAVRTSGKARSGSRRHEVRTDPPQPAAGRDAPPAAGDPWFPTDTEFRDVTTVGHILALIAGHVPGLAIGRETRDREVGGPASSTHRPPAS